LWRRAAGSRSRGGAVVRAFVCVSPDEAAAGEIADFARGLKKFSGFRWAARESLHVTLKFLGEMPAERVTRLDTNLSRVGGFRPFAVGVSEAGVFPDMSSPRVLWLGVGDGRDELTRLAALVDRAAAAAGCEPERRVFHPHLTLARSRGSGPGVMTSELAEALAAFPGASWMCENFVLMRSELSPRGAKYTPIARFPL
jgi:2'-5' RNA ligase